MKDNGTRDGLAARLEDMCALAGKRGCAVFSSFLNDREQYDAAALLGRRHGISLTFWGGSDACARRMLGVSPYEDEPAAPEEFPIYSLTLSYRKADKPDHRDILGSVMGLGLERDTVGDIFIGETAAAVYCTKTARDVILDTLVRVGRAGVSVSDGLSDDAAEAVRPAGFTELTVNIASQRADCIAAGITGLSREKAAAFIRSGSFMLNYAECDNISKPVSAGDVLTLRGYGKFIVSDDAVTTKKGRLRLTLKKYA